MRTLLRERRELKGKTQLEVASSANISLKSYQRIERGKQAPSVDVAIPIAKSLDSTVEDLFTSDDTTRTHDNQ